MTAKNVARMSRYEILDALIDDGFEIEGYDAAEVSKTIQQAARAGALLWSENEIVSTLRNAPLTLRK